MSYANPFRPHPLSGIAIQSGERIRRAHDGLSRTDLDTLERMAEAGGKVCAGEDFETAALERIRGVGACTGAAYRLGGEMLYSVTALGDDIIRYARRRRRERK